MRSPMSFFIKKSISKKFIFWISVIIFSVFILFCAVFIPYDALSIKRDMNDHADNILAFSMKSLQNAMWQYDNNYITDYIDTLLLYEDVVFACAFSEGNVIKKTTRNGYQDIDFLNHSDSEQFIIRRGNIAYDKQLIGEIVFAMTTHRVKDQVYKNIIAVSVLFFVIAIIASIAIVILFKNNIQKPLLNLNLSANQISTGDLMAPIDTSSEDEIGQLAKNLDDMIQNIRSITTSRDELNREVDERKRIEQTLLAERDKLQGALSEIKVLRGILPVCSFCKKIRDDQGSWNQIEAYIQEHSDAEFSHSICKECANKHYPDLHLYDKDGS